MCGITGLLSAKAQRSETVEIMTGALKHRGPDAQKWWGNTSNTIFVGHTRLSIIDLSSSANQPLQSSDGRYIIVFNGEIYNFKTVRATLEKEYGCHFKTSSDTEVLIEAFCVWKQDMVSRLQGMFALAIVDQQEQCLYLLRDRAGKKPLYYFHSDQLFAFASEIKSLIQHPQIKQQLQVDRNAAEVFLHLGYIPQPHTIYKNIQKFPAAHWGRVDHTLKLVTTSYWTITSKAADALPLTQSEETVKDTLRSLLNESVKDRLISDVPLGAFLSGGTDSSLVTAVAQQYVSNSLKTFSIGFTENTFDETSYAEQVSRCLKTDHTAYRLSEKEAIDILETYLSHFDEPFADTSAIPTMLVSKLAKQQVTVALTGDGGDELFQGYGAYTWANRLQSSLWRAARQPLAWTLQATGKSRLQRIAKLLSNEIGSMRSHIFSQEQYLFSQRELRDHVLKSRSGYTLFEYSEPALQGIDLTAGEKQALFDLQYYLQDDLLVKVDRASMYYALECRSPLLDSRMVEFATSLNHQWKIRHGQSKWILKELLREHIPDAMVDRPKWGFSVPLAAWLKNDLRYLIEDYLNERVVEKVGLCHLSYVQHLVAEFRRGKQYLYNRVWALIVLHRWMHQNEHSFGK